MVKKSYGLHEGIYSENNDTTVLQKSRGKSVLRSKASQNPSLLANEQMDTREVRAYNEDLNANDDDDLVNW